MSGPRPSVLHPRALAASAGARLALGVVALTAGLWIGGADAQVAPPFTIDPVMTKGPADAPVTIVEFSDYQCPYCLRAEQVLGELLDEFPEKVRLVFKDFPLRFHGGAEPAAVAARCAGESGRYWEYHDMLFVAQGDFARADLITYAVRLGLPREPFIACLDGGRYRAAVQADVREGRAAGVTGTPTFFVNGRRMAGVQSLDAFREAVRDALDDARAKP